MINERMQELISVVSNGNKRAFSKLVGVNPTVIENIVGTRQGKPGYELLGKIAFSIENINLDWLLTGRGSMFDAVGQSPLTGESTRQVVLTANESVYQALYKEKDAKVEMLMKENGILEERIRQLENSKTGIAVLNNAKDASLKKCSSLSTTNVGSAAVLSENI